MNKKWIGQTFLTLAILLVIFLGVFEYFENQAKQTESSSCRVESVNTDVWKNSEIVGWNDKAHVVAFDKETKALKKYSWKVNESKLALIKESEINLICTDPDYNCIQSHYFESNVEVDMIYFKPPYGLLNVKYGAREMVFPFFWDAQAVLRLGAPLKMCSENVNSENFEIASVGNQIFFYKNISRLLGTFDLSNINGASPASIGKEPDQIYTVSTSGFLSEGTCKDAQSSNKSLYWVPNKDKFLFYSPGSSVSLYSYYRAFSPITQFEEKPTGVLPIENDYLLFENNTVKFIQNRGTMSIDSAEIERLFLKNFDGALLFFWRSASLIGKIEQKRWLRKRTLRLLSLESSKKFPDDFYIEFGFLTEKDRFSSSVEESQNTLYLWNQTHRGDFSLRSISCH